MTYPISNGSPTDVDLQLNKSLRSYLERANLLDDAPRKARRQQAVQAVENACRNWIATQTGGKKQGRIVLHGSVVFDAQLRSGDIDGIFICPNSVSNDQFFRGVPGVLRNNALFSNVQAITTAKWPIIKLRVSGEFDVDLQPLVCKLVDVPEDIGERSVLRASEMLELFSISKYDALRPMRITQFITAALAETSISMAEYRLALQALKYWAKQNNIYGFDRFRKGAGMAGLSWTLLLVFVCQHNPQANCAVTLLRLVMKTFGQDWPWPRPVCLRLVKQLRSQGEYASSAPGQHSNMPSEKGLMPIMTPLPETVNRIDLIKYSHEKTRLVAPMQSAAMGLRNASVVGGAGSNFWDVFFVKSYR